MYIFGFVAVAVFIIIWVKFIFFNSNREYISLDKLKEKITHDRNNKINQIVHEFLSKLNSSEHRQFTSFAIRFSTALIISRHLSHCKECNKRFGVDNIFFDESYSDLVSIDLDVVKIGLESIEKYLGHNTE